jgi:NAD(P)-dependent dehydrogenase (short-subunit alcohol dehydrogenase family)
MLDSKTQYKQKKHCGNKHLLPARQLKHELKDNQYRHICKTPQKKNSTRRAVRNLCPQRLFCIWLEGQKHSTLWPMDSIILTGCTRGLGRAMTFFFANHGFAVHGCGTSEASLEELRSSHPFPHSFSRVDLADDAAVARWAKSILAYGTPKFLINNAARIARNAPLWELSAEEINTVVDVNLKGSIHTIRYFVPAMIAQGNGVVVNFSSGWGRSTSPAVAIYCATKFAIEGLTASLAQDLPKGLAVVALNPGVINTDMLASCFGKSADDSPSPEEWVQTAGPFVLGLGSKDNGKSLSVPGFSD